MVETVLCEHCGAQTKHPVTKMIDGRALNFCCRGCLQVYELLREEGLRSGQTEQVAQAPAQPEPAHPLGRQPGDAAPSETITLSITGMTCANCVAHVGGSLRSVPGVVNVDVKLATGLAKVEMISGMATMADLKHAVETAGYKVA